jgi:hypothetical protein
MLRGKNESEFELPLMSMLISAFGLHERVMDPVLVVAVDENTS